MTKRAPTPHWGRAAALGAALLCALSLPAEAKPKRRAKPAPAAPAPVEKAAPTPLEQKADKPTPAKTEASPPKKIKEQNFNFDGLGLNGRSRSPQLLYFLERANEELERASLEKRSFIPHIVKTVEEEQL